MKRKLSEGKNVRALPKIAVHDVSFMSFQICVHSTGNIPMSSEKAKPLRLYAFRHKVSVAFW